jgi:hypothetical protein
MRVVRSPNGGRIRGKRTDHNPTAPGLLAANKISYLGCYRFPNNDTITAYGGMAGRKVAGKVRLFAHASKDTYGAKGTITSAASASEFTATMGFESIYGEIAIGTVIGVYDPTVTALPQVRTVTGATPPFAGAGSYTYTVDSPLSTTPSAGWIVFKTDDPIMEFELPDHSLNPPTSSYTTAPQATRVAYWPDPYRGRRHTYRENPPGTWTHDQDSNAPNHYFPVNLYWHEDFQALYMTYISTYTVTGPPDWGLCAAQLGAPSTLGGSDGTVVAGGPWRTAHTDRYDHTWYGPGRMGIIGRKHASDNMIGGGVTRSGVHSNSWGPSLWGAAEFPEIGVTPDGFGALPTTNDIPGQDRYLEYYYPSMLSDAAIEDGNFINKDGTWEGTIPSYQHKKPTGYSHIFEPDYDTPRNMVDPAQNSGIATWTPADAITGIFWFDDGTQKAVIFSGTFALSTILDEEDEDAAHIFYRNEHEYSLHYNPATLVGSFTQGEVIRGNTSLSTLNAGNISHTPTLNKVQGGHTPGVVQDWTIGEQLEGLTSGATATLTIAHRHNWCNHGFTEIVTGDFTTAAIPVLILYDPARLETNKIEVTDDYTTDPYEVIDLIDTFGIEVSNSVAGTYRNLSIGWYDEETRNLYCIALAADLTLGGPSAQSLCHIFHIAE